MCQMTGSGIARVSLFMSQRYIQSAGTQAHDEHVKQELSVQETLALISCTHTLHEKAITVGAQPNTTQTLPMQNGFSKSGAELLPPSTLRPRRGQTRQSSCESQSDTIGPEPLYK